MGRMMRVLDVDLSGNVAKFFLGRSDLDFWYGDDWDDSPYEHNAGLVYCEFVDDELEVAFPLDHVVSEPCDGHWNSAWSKEDMRLGYVPMFATLVPKESDRWRYESNFDAVVADVHCKRVYMGDVVDVDDLASWLGEGARKLREVKRGGGF